jgi:hypothetical protein
VEHDLFGKPVSTYRVKARRRPFRIMLESADGPMAAISTRAVSAPALWQLKIANSQISQKAAYAGDPGLASFICFCMHNQVAYRARRASGRPDLVEVPMFVWKAVRIDEGYLEFAQRRRAPLA